MSSPEFRAGQRVVHAARGGGRIDRILPTARRSRAVVVFDATPTVPATVWLADCTLDRALVPPAPSPAPRPSLRVISDPVPA